MLLGLRDWVDVIPESRLRSSRFPNESAFGDIVAHLSERGFYAAHIACSYRDPADQRRAEMAIQQWMGLLPERWAGASPADSVDFVSDGSHLTMKVTS